MEFESDFSNISHYLISWNTSWIHLYFLGFPFAISKICTEKPHYLSILFDFMLSPLLYELLQLTTIKRLWKSLFFWSTFRTCVRECQTTGIIGENVISHCQSKENDTSVGGSWYNQEQIYIQWKQLNCRTDCRYFCMMQREGERQSLGLSPVKYHGKWPFLRVSVFQVCLVLTRSRVWNNYFYH